MPIKYLNFRGQDYFLHKSVTKTGKNKYFFSLKNEGDLVESIPDGYEIYENPNGRVFLRRIQAKIINDDEIRIVKDGINKFSAEKNCKIDIKKDVIIVYAPDQNVKELAAVLSIFPSGKNSKSKESLLSKFITYSPIFQFELVDDERRTFQARRYCYLGSIDDWIEIGSENPLPKLCKRYLKHIGKESYYELDM